MQKLIQIDENYNQKSMKNHPKIDQKSSKNQSKNTKNPPKNDLGGVLAPLGVSWCLSGGVLATSGGASRRRPGASWGCLAGVLGVIQAVLRAYCERKSRLHLGGRLLVDF